MHPVASALLALLPCFFWMAIVATLPYNGQTKITQTGTDIQLRVQGGNGGVKVSEYSFSLAQNYEPNVKLLTSASSFYRLPNLLGKSIEFTVDVSHSTYGCNAAFYMFEPPSWQSTDYYCDAQCPNGACCNEIDIMEANTHAFQTTMHCNDGTNACKWGCAKNWKANDYGSGDQYTINTEHPFTVIASFEGSGSNLEHIYIKLFQDDKYIHTVLNDDYCQGLKEGYISGLSSAITGGNLVLSVSYWNGDMSWMDGSWNQCDKSENNLYSVSNIKIRNNLAARYVGQDETATTSIFAFASPVLSAVIVLGVVVVVLAIVVAVVVIQKRSTIETV